MKKTARYNLRNRAADRVRRAARPGVGQQNAGETPRTRHPSASATGAGGNTLKTHRPGTGTASAGG